MITKQQFVETVNHNLNLPLIGEATEATLIELAVAQLWDVLPPVVWQAMADSSDGIDSEDLDRILDAAASLLAKRFDWKLVPEATRKQVLDQIFLLIRQTAKLDNFIAFVSK